MEVCNSVHSFKFLNGLFGRFVIERYIIEQQHTVRVRCHTLDLHLVAVELEHVVKLPAADGGKVEILKAYSVWYLIGIPAENVRDCRGYVPLVRCRNSDRSAKQSCCGSGYDNSLFHKMFSVFHCFRLSVKNRAQQFLVAPYGGELVKKLLVLIIHIHSSLESISFKRSLARESRVVTDVTEAPIISAISFTEYPS